MYQGMYQDVSNGYCNIRIILAGILTWEHRITNNIEGMKHVKWGEKVVDLQITKMLLLVESCESQNQRQTRRRSFIDVSLYRVSIFEYILQPVGGNVETIMVEY